MGRPNALDAPMTSPCSARFVLLPLLALLLAGPVLADEERGKELYGPCAACHGDYGQGGKKGEYPRIAGQQAKYIESQLKAFQKRIRVNIPMVPYTEERELPAGEMKEVAAYLNGIELPTAIPEFKDTDDALTRLTAMEKVMIVPREPGDVDAGKAIFQKNCAACHGKTAKGRGMFPRLVGQYTNYLKRQIAFYLKGERPHDEEGPTGILNTLGEGDIQNVLAYVTALQEEVNK